MATNSAGGLDYLIWGILETVMCCLSCGIVVVYANKVNTQAALGNLTEALDVVKITKSWLIAGIVM